MATRRRDSQKSWHHNRGRVRADIPCEGGGTYPEQITFKGDWHLDPVTSKPRGELPRGLCPACGDEIALNVLDKSGTPTIRKHKDANAPYKRQLLVSEETFRLLYQRHLKTEEQDPDELADALLRSVLEEDETIDFSSAPQTKE